MTMWHSTLVYVLAVLTSTAITLPEIAGKLVNNSSIPALFVFGDSTVDPGNNNNLQCVFKSNFAPYGMHYNNCVATGRFTDGRLLTDYLASYLGLKENVPAYLESPSLEEMMTGVSFASGGSGLDPLTPQISGVLSVGKQLEYLKEYKAKIESAIGEKRTKALIGKAVFIISAGTNDIAITYLSTPFRRSTYNITAYQQFLLRNLHLLIQGLRSEGAQLIAVVGQPPIGCLPVIISLYSQSVNPSRSCIDSISSMAIHYNHMLQEMLDAARTPDSNLIYVDIYNILSEMISNPSKHGFDEVNTGCCGSGLLETSCLCNPISTICSDPSKYVFFDSIHPTEVAYHHIFKALIPLVNRVLK